MIVDPARIDTDFRLSNWSFWKLFSYFLDKLLIKSLNILLLRSLIQE